MLRQPTKGFAPSVNRHNVDLNAFSEWLEGCITFTDENISQSEIIDILLEEGIYRSQDFARERLADAWIELERRAGILRAAGPYVIDGARLVRRLPWQDVPAFSFCLMAALQVRYREIFTNAAHHDYTQQGLLLERLTAEAMRAIGWRAYATGWSKTVTASIADKLAELASQLGENHRPEAISAWTGSRAKDAGLDVVCHLPFPDSWSGRPLLYVQCASGDDWEAKRASPNLELWNKLMDVATQPRRGIAVPFAFLASEFRLAANYDSLSLLLDRHRLCAPPARTDGWLSRELRDDLVEWTTTRVPYLSQASAD